MALAFAIMAIPYYLAARKLSEETYPWDSGGPAFAASIPILVLYAAGLLHSLISLSALIGGVIENSKVTALRLTACLFLLPTAYLLYRVVMFFVNA